MPEEEGSLSFACCNPLFVHAAKNGRRNVYDLYWPERVQKKKQCESIAAYFLTVSQKESTAKYSSWSRKGKNATKKVYSLKKGYNIK